MDFQTLFDPKWGMTNLAEFVEPPDLFKRWLSVGLHDLREPVVEELLLGWNLEGSP